MRSSRRYPVWRLQLRPVSMLALNLSATFLEESPPASSQSTRWRNYASPYLLTILHPIPGNLQWNFQLLWQHHILPHQHKDGAHPCPHTSVICDPLKTKFEGSSSTCWAEVLFSFAISFQEPFTLPMSAQVLYQQIHLFASILV